MVFKWKRIKAVKIEFGKLEGAKKQMEVLKSKLVGIKVTWVTKWWYSETLNNKAQKTKNNKIVLCFLWKKLNIIFLNCCDSRLKPFLRSGNAFIVFAFYEAKSKQYFQRYLLHRSQFQTYDSKMWIWMQSCDNQTNLRSFLIFGIPKDIPIPIELHESNSTEPNMPLWTAFHFVINS